MKYLSIFIIFLSVSCSSQKEKKNINKKAELYYNQGTLYLTQKKYPDAISHLTQAMNFSPNDSKIYNNLAMAYYFKNRIETAQKLLEKSIELDPKNDDARLNLASLYLEKGELDKSYESFRILRNKLTYKKQDQVLYNMAMLEFKRNDTRQGIFYLKESLKENEYYCPSSFKLAMHDYNQEKYQQANIKLRKAIKGNCFNYPQAHFYLGVTYIKNNRVLEGITQLEQMIENHPDSEYALKAKKEINIARALLTANQKEGLELSKQYNVRTPKF